MEMGRHRILLYTVSISNQLPDLQLCKSYTPVTLATNLEWASGCKTINFMLMGTQEFWQYEGIITEANGNAIRQSGISDISETACSCFRFCSEAMGYIFKFESAICDKNK